MKSVCFVLPKNPAEFHGGDMTVSKLMMSLAAQSCKVSALALTQSEDLLGAGPYAYGIAKPPVKLANVATQSVLRGRSPLNVRFDVPALRDALRTAEHDVFVAEHSYMAESILSSPAARDRLWINTHVSEADVARTSRRPTERMTAGFTLRDEIKVARQARHVGCFDRHEIARYEAHGIRNTTLFKITRPPAAVPTDVASTTAAMLFLGDQTWRPNHEALLKLMTLWPQIRAEVPDATLNVVGRRNPKLRWRDSAGAKHWGFVDDLTPFLTQSRAIAAPVLTGGGVRVKLLEACSIGLPIVASPAAVGSLDETLGLKGHGTDAEFVAESVRALKDAQYAERLGREVYDRNAQFWIDGGPQRSVENWLSDPQHDE